MSSKQIGILPEALDVEKAVTDRYKEGAQERQPELCCPVEYDVSYLKIIPQEIIDKDYGCGDPSQYVREGETVLDLGSGGGKICYIAAQKVGSQGKVIGIDMNDTMLKLANKYKDEVAKTLGYDVVDFRKGMIQDLKLNAGLYEGWLKQHPVTTLKGMQAAEIEAERLRREEILVEDNSVDVVVSNCVLNLVRDGQKKQLFEEIFRTLKRGGRAVISDIVSDEVVPQHLREDAELWSGCISGAFQEAEFLKAFEEVGFYGIRVLKRDAKPWQVVEGIEFRSVTIEAIKGKEGPCLDRGQAVIYGGPWKEVKDDDGHTLRRGERMAVCDKTYDIYTHPQGPYARYLVGIEPEKMIPLDAAPNFNCRANSVRDPKDMKGSSVKVVDFDPDSDLDGPACGPGCC